MDFYAALQSNFNQNPTCVLTSNGVVAITNSVNSLQMQQKDTPGKQSHPFGDKDLAFKTKINDIYGILERERKSIFEVKMDDNTDFQGLFRKYKEQRWKEYHTLKPFYEQDKAYWHECFYGHPGVHPPTNMGDTSIRELYRYGTGYDTDSD